MSVAAPAAVAHLHARGAFLEQVEVGVHRTVLGTPAPLALIVARVDAFRLFNDCYGYVAGDQLVEQISLRLRALAGPLARSFSGDVTLGHLHADEFALLLEGIEEDDAGLLVARLLSQLSGSYEFGGRTHVASFSIGCACAVSGEGTASQFLGEARAAMRRARVLGGGRYDVFSAQARARFALRAHIGRDLHLAADAGQLHLVYQPIVNLETFTVEGLEALLRWEHPQLGMIPPGEFIPIAVESGQIGALGDWVLERACSEFSELRSAPGLSGTRFVAINVSRKNLGDARLPDKVLAALKAARLDPEALHLEITESELANNLEAALATVQTLRSLGVGLAIDDFGVGYSSLASLHEFPIDVLKLDKSFIASDVSTRKGRGLMAVAHATINLARNMGLRVVAEGVETSAQLALLHSLHCDLAQGYLLGRPLPPAQLREFRVSPLAPDQALPD